jgi:uncharacterized protein
MRMEVMMFVGFDVCYYNRYSNTFMTIHETIKNQIKDAMRAKDEVKLLTLRGLSAAFTNELLSKGATAADTSNADLLGDESSLALIKRSVKQHRDSIEQFEKGGRKDLADNERAELVILETYLPATMSRDEIRKKAEAKLAAAGIAKLEKAGAGKFMGEFLRELKTAGLSADGADVKAVIDSLVA